MSESNFIIHKNVVLNLGKSLGRKLFRKDGLVPTLGHGCTMFFLPAYAAFLEVPQLLCVTGLHPVNNPKEFKLARDMKKRDMDLLIGNAMRALVVGHVMAVALGIITP